MCIGDIYTRLYQSVISKMCYTTSVNGGFGMKGLTDPDRNHVLIVVAFFATLSVILNIRKSGNVLSCSYH